MKRHPLRSWGVALFCGVVLTISNGGIVSTPDGDALGAASIHLLNPPDLGFMPTISSRAHSYIMLATSPPSDDEQSASFVVSKGTSQVASITASRSGAYWATAWEVPLDLPPGAYRVAIELSELGSLVARDEQAVMIDSWGGSEGQEGARTLRYTSSRSRAFYKPPDKRPGTTLGLTSSDPGGQAVGYYTTSAPGAEPRWLRCGRAPVENSPGSNSSGAAISCVIAGGDRWRAVSAVLAVANDAPFPDKPTSEMNGSTAATAIRPYRAKLFLRLNLLTNFSQERCWLVLAQTWSDGLTEEDLSQPVARSPVDFHLVHDAGMGSFAPLDRSYPFRAPDSSHAASAPSATCVDPLPGLSQSVHKGGAVHVESVRGTNVNGDFEIGVMPRVNSGIWLRAWVDQNDDDRYQATEKSDVLSW